MKNKTMTTNIGTINLAELNLVEDSLEVFIPIITVSDNLKAIVEEQTEKAKKEFEKEFADKNLKWNKAGADITYQSLHIVVENHEVSSELCFDITDRENEFVETCFKLKVDLSEYMQELKKLILKTMIDKFF